MNSPDPFHSEPVFLGVDVGGTSVKLGWVTDSGTVLAQTSFPTRADQSPDVALQGVSDAVQEWSRRPDMSHHRIVAAGIGTPGPIDIKRGYILEPTNLPGWRDFPIRDRLSERLQLPVTFTNDANAAGFGEYWLGSARDYNSLVLITLGTGVGGGIIIDNVCLEGAHGLGAEVGHIRIESGENARVCSCGRKGHLEAYASATAVVERTRDALTGHSSTLSQLERLTAKAIFDAAEAGDALANTVIDQTADHLGDGIALVAHVIDPEAVLLGGAMTFGGRETRTGQRFLDRIMTRVRESTFPEISENMKIDFASLGSKAGYIGAAGLARASWMNRRNPSLASP